MLCPLIWTSEYTPTPRLHRTRIRPLPKIAAGRRSYLRSIQQTWQIFAADDFAAAGLEVGIGIHAYDLEAHVIGFVEGGDGCCSKGVGEVIAQEAGFGASKVEEGGRCLCGGVFPDQASDGKSVPVSNRISRACLRSEYREAWFV